jgi:RsiW-degrading membrane proteinase PrsW (M82 family)
MDFLSLLALALAPGAAISFYLYWRDEHEKEPIRLIRKAFLFGLLSVLITSILSIIPPIIFNIDIESLLTGEASYSPLQMLAFTVLGIGLVEEFSKWIIMRSKILFWVNFNEPFDGILYSVMVSLGFATLENIMYVLGSAAVEIEGGYITGFLRMFTAVPAHAICGVIMGYYFGKSKFEPNHQAKYLALALIAPALFHGAYDYFAFLNWVPGIIGGAITSLVVGAILANKAMTIHIKNSPFHPEQTNSSLNKHELPLDQDAG